MNKTKEHIIRKSIQLYNKKGFDLSVKQIIEYSKVSNGSFFYFFKKKEYLLDEIFDYIKEDFNKNTTKTHNNYDDFLKEIHESFNNIVNWGVKKNNYFLFLLKFKNKDKKNKNNQNEDKNILFSILNNLIEKGVDNEYFKDIDPILLTDIAVSSLAHIVFYLNENKKEKKDKYFVLFLDLIKNNANKNQLNSINDSSDDDNFV